MFKRFINWLFPKRAKPPAPYECSVVTTYRANVDDHIAALERLKVAERLAADATIESHKRVEASLEALIALRERAGAERLSVPIECFAKRVQ